MEYLTPSFTKDMADDYTLLIPDMCPISFAMVKAAMESEGYHRVVMLDNGGPNVAQLGLKYVHNDTCYPALLIIGQMLDALNSGEYDLKHTACMITQSGGGCRASNYIKLLRKALVKAGYGYIPVASANASSLEQGSTMHWTVPMLEKILAALEYGDEISLLRNQTTAYELHKGDADALTQKWIDTVNGWFWENKNYKLHDMNRIFGDIADSFAKIPMDRSQKKVKTAVVGEIYVKFSPLGNNHLVDFLLKEGCEVLQPPLMGYAMYCVANWSLDIAFYGGKKLTEEGWKMGLKFLDGIAQTYGKAMRKCGFYAPGPFTELMKKPEGTLSLGAKMGEGWLLTGEMAECIENGYPNIICAQPFGCLPNHIAGKGVINKLRERYPQANITAVDYDPSQTAVNQENRIKLMLAVGRENLQNA